MAGKSYIYYLYTSIGKLWDFIGNCPLAMFDYRRIPFLTRLRRLRSFFLNNYGTISQPSTGGERGPVGPIKIKNTHQLWCCLLHPFWWFLVVPPLVLVLYICYLLHFVTMLLLLFILERLLQRKLVVQTVSCQPHDARMASAAALIDYKSHTLPEAHGLVAHPWRCSPNARASCGCGYSSTLAAQSADGWLGNCISISISLYI